MYNGRILVGKGSKLFFICVRIVGRRLGHRPHTSVSCRPVDASQRPFKEMDEVTSTLLIASTLQQKRTGRLGLRLRLGLGLLILARHHDSTRHRLRLTTLSTPKH